MSGSGSIATLDAARVVAAPRIKITATMINIFINLDQSRDRVETELLEKIKYIDKNSIVRLVLNHPVHNKNYYRLTINRIHELLPPTLTFQVNAVYQDGL